MPSRFGPGVLPSGESPIGAGLRAATEGFVKGRQLKEQRERARLRREAAARRRAQHEVEMARRGFRPEGATEEVPSGELPSRGEGRSTSFENTDPSGGGTAAFEEALRTARGENQRRPFTPGDVRQDGPGVGPTLADPTPGPGGRLPETGQRALEEAPGRIALPGGGSIPETPPEVQRRREREEGLIGGLTEGFEARQRGEEVDPRTRAGVLVRTGQDVLAPPEREVTGVTPAGLMDLGLSERQATALADAPADVRNAVAQDLLNQEPEEGEWNPSNNALRVAGVSDEQVRRLSNEDPETRQAVFKEHLGRQPGGRGEGDIEDDPAYNEAVQMWRADPELDPQTVKEETGLTLTRVLDAQERANRSLEEAPSFEREENVEQVYGPPIGKNEEVAREAIARHGGERQAHAWLDGIITDEESSQQEIRRAQILKAALTRYSRRETESAQQATAQLVKILSGATEE